MKKSKEKENGVKAEIWSLIIHEGVMDMLHGGGRRVSELYIPSSGIVINSVDGRVCCFRDDGSRYKKPGKLTTNHAQAVKHGHVYVPIGIYMAVTAMLEVSDVLKTKVEEISELCNVEEDKKSRKKAKNGKRNKDS